MVMEKTNKEKEGVLLCILILILPPPRTHTIIVRVQVTTNPVVVFVENKRRLKVWSKIWFMRLVRRLHVEKVSHTSQN